MVRKLNNLLPLEKETERKDILGGETFPTERTEIVSQSYTGWVHQSLVHLSLGSCLSHFFISTWIKRVMTKLGDSDIHPRKVRREVIFKRYIPDIHPEHSPNDTAHLSPT